MTDEIKQDIKRLNQIMLKTPQGDGTFQVINYEEAGFSEGVEISFQETGDGRILTTSTHFDDERFYESRTDAWVDLIESEIARLERALEQRELTASL
jgi:hypothetical protein